MSNILKHKLKTMAVVAAGGAIVFLGTGLYKNDEKVYRNLLIPIAHCLDPERAHWLAVLSAKFLGLLSGFDRKRASSADPDILRTNVWNIEFSNPIGIAAGFDKNGEAISGLFKIGFGFAEIGSVTPKAQPGNPKPRIFRLTEDKAIINRYGFNSDGHDAVHKRLLNFVPAHIKKTTCHGIIAINLGKNKSSEENDDNDYVEGVRRFANLVDFLVINISSPNTPGLRNMQAKDALNRLLDAVMRERKSLGSTTPILIKIAPDLTREEKQDIANVILAKGVDGIIVSNTTISRPPTLASSLAIEKGGLSGKPLREISTEAIQEIYMLTNGNIPIIGVGGISSGKDAYEKIRAGASLVEFYTALVYEGPPLVAKIKRELEELLRTDGFRSVTEAVGANHRNT